MRRTLQKMCDRTPMKKLGEVDDIALAALYLASPAAKVGDGQDTGGGWRHGNHQHALLAFRTAGHGPLKVRFHGGIRARSSIRAVSGSRWHPSSKMSLPLIRQLRIGPSKTLGYYEILHRRDLTSRLLQRALRLARQEGHGITGTVARS